MRRLTSAGDGSAHMPAAHRPTASGTFRRRGGDRDRTSTLHRPTRTRRHRAPPAAAADDRAHTRVAHPRTASGTFRRHGGHRCRTSTFRRPTRTRRHRAPPAAAVDDRAHTPEARRIRTTCTCRRRDAHRYRTRTHHPTMTKRTHRPLLAAGDVDRHRRRPSWTRFARRGSRRRTGAQREKVFACSEDRRARRFVRALGASRAHRRKPCVG